MPVKEKDFVDRLVDPFTTTWEWYKQAWNHPYRRIAMAIIHVLMVDALVFYLIYSPARDVHNNYAENMVQVVCDDVMQATIKNPLGVDVFNRACLSFENDVNMGTWRYIVSQWMETRLYWILHPIQFTIGFFFDSFLSTCFTAGVVLFIFFKYFTRQSITLLIDNKKIEV
jgi:uncharacterized membrane protein